MRRWAWHAPQRQPADPPETRRHPCPHPAPPRPALALAIAALIAALPAAAETVKIGFIEVLSGPFAKAGEGSLAQLREVVQQLNAQAGPKDPTFEVVPFDGKGAPQESG